jgi:nicotinamide mononucleotide transporter
MNLILQIIATALSLAHVTLNVFKKRVCWLFNITALLLWIWLYLRTNFPIIAGLMTVYIVLSVFGWVQWGKAERT